MKFDDLLKKQLAEIADFEKARDEAWKKIREGQDAIKAAFADREDQIPQNIKQKMEKERREFSREWGSKGAYYLQMDKRHLVERLQANHFDGKKFRDGSKKSLLAFKNLDKER